MTILTHRLTQRRASQPIRLRAGWWLLPAVIGGAAGWIALIWAVVT